MASQPASKSDYGAAPLDLNVTRDLAAFLARLRFDELPEAAVHEARRGVVDWIGCALAGSRHRTIDRLLPVLTALNAQPQATVLGRGLKLGMTEASLANGQMGHML